MALRLIAVITIDSICLNVIQLLLIHFKEWCASSATTLSGLGGVVQRRFGDGRGLIDSRRAEALSGVMVTSTAGKTKIILIYILRIARWFEGGDGFCSMRMRCS
jgi:hypothetical protein